MYLIWYCQPLPLVSILWMIAILDSFWGSLVWEWLDHKSYRGHQDLWQQTLSCYCTTLHSGLYCTVLYCSPLCGNVNWTLLHYTILNCNALQKNELYCTQQDWTTWLFKSVMYWVALHWRLCTALSSVHSNYGSRARESSLDYRHYSVLYRELHCIAMHCSAPNFTVVFIACDRGVVQCTVLRAQPWPAIGWETMAASDWSACPGQ